MHQPKISSDTVKAKTGKSWDEWFALMDASGCAKMRHKEIVAVLHNQFNVGNWWQQMIPDSYEQSCGKRLLNQRLDGYQISKSKTYSVNIETAFNAWAEESIRIKWLADPGISIRKTIPNHSLRIIWVDGITGVDVLFNPKGEKVQISVNHRQLPDSQTAEEINKYWAEQLNKLEEFLE